MPDIVQFTSTRQIEPLPAHVTLAKAIFTHLTPERETLYAAGLALTLAQVDGQILPISVSDLLDKFVKDPTKGWKPGGAFYNALLELHNKCKIDKIITLAAEYLEEEGVTAARELKPQSQVAAEYFRHSNPSLISAHIESFAKGIPDLDVYLKKNVGEELRRVCDSLLAVRVLGLPVSYEAELIHLLRTILTLYYLGDYFQNAVPNDKSFPIAWFIELWRLPIYLPHWSFDVKPCDCKKRKKPVLEMSQTASLSKELDLLKGSTSSINSASAKVAVTEADEAQVDDKCNCCDESDPPCMPENPCCVDIDLFVTDYYVLRDETFCYKPGDIAYIEVIAAGEKRTRIHSTKTVTEDFSETESTTSKKEERDHQVTEKSSLQSEISKQIEKSMDVTAKADWGTYKLETNGKLSRSDSEKVAREMTKEMVDKAVLSLQEEVRIKQSRKVTMEVSESNKHTFKNDGVVPKITKYFWVTQQKKAQVYSYGKRATAELIIPSPAMLYEKLVELKRLKEFGRKPPMGPGEFVDGAGVLITASTISDGNYQALALKYKVSDVPAPPPSQQLVTVLSETGNSSISVPVPDGYVAVSVGADGTHNNKGAKESTLDWRAGNAHLYYGQASGDRWDDVIEPNEGPGLVVNVVSQAMESWSYYLLFTCNLTPEKRLEWQETVYDKLRAPYDADVEAHNKALEEYETDLAEFNRQYQLKTRNRNPFFNREIERAELKRAAIYLMCQRFDKKGPMNMKSEPCGYPEMDRELAQELGYDWYFWDRAFDWDLLSYIFLDYFWNPMCTWPDKFDPDDPDALFKAFRRAGYARLMVPVAEGMEDDVEYYLATGQKWGQTGTPPKSPSDSRWRDLVTEIKHQRHCRQTDREGIVDCAIPANQKRIVTIKGSDRYWDPTGTGQINQVEMDLDIDREIFIDLAIYRIAAIGKSTDANAPAYDPNNLNNMWWEITLERDFEGDTSKQHKYAVGAKFIGAPFLYELPTELVWAGAHGDCLPCYPIPCKEE